MGNVIGSATVVSVAANTTTANVISSSKMFLPKGLLELYARPSATGMNIKLTVNGFAIVDSTAAPFYGTAGALTKKDHQITQVMVNGGAVELTFQNTTGAAITYDYILEHTPTK
jgi:hypothetical protein